MPKIILVTGLFYIALALLGTYQFLSTFLSDTPLPLENGVLPILSIVSVVSVFSKKSWGRYVVVGISIFLAIAITLLTYFMGAFNLASLETMLFIVVLTLLISISLTFILNNGVKNYYGT